MTAETTKTLTVKEFKYWLTGVEEMQDAEWTPSNTQWRRIRDKINNIELISATVVSQPNNTVNITHRPPEALAAPVYATSNMMANPGAELAGRPFLPESVGIPARTPAIDTSNGQYNSAFA